LLYFCFDGRFFRTGASLPLLLAGVVNDIVDDIVVDVVVDDVVVDDRGGAVLDRVACIGGVARSGDDEEEEEDGGSIHAFSFRPP
jgi:hypothetical protein